MKNPQTILIFIVIAAIIFFIVKTKLKNQINVADTDTTRPSENYLPKQEIRNDKLVLVNDISSTDIDSILNGFCNMYNKEKFQSQPRLFKLTERQFAITFPFDIDFEIYCYFINYVHYPMGFDKSFNVTGWTTTKSSDSWITEESANKKAMLFIPTDDTEHDNVFMITSDNIGFKLGFAMGEEKQLLDSPIKSFISPTIDIQELTNKEYKDFK